MAAPTATDSSLNFAALALPFVVVGGDAPPRLTILNTHCGELDIGNITVSATEACIQMVVTASGLSLTIATIVCSC